MPNRKKSRTMEYQIAYLRPTNSWFINKSQKPHTIFRHQLHRAFNPERPDYNCEFYQDIRDYGEEAFILRYCLELPDFCEGKRAHYVKNSEPNEEIYHKVLSMRQQPLCEDACREIQFQKRQERREIKRAEKEAKKNGHERRG